MSLFLSISRYFIEVFKDGQWMKVEPIKEINAWIDEGWMIRLNTIVDITDFSWEKQYGALPAGQYRMGKRVHDSRGPGDYDYATFYAEFTIE